MGQRSGAERPLAGTVALVTGASDGIGRATAVCLAGAGATVVAVARRAERLAATVAEANAAGGTAYALVCDLADAAAPADVVEAVVADHGRLDIVVNNAGTMLVGDVLTADPGDWARMAELNLMAVMRCTHAALPHLLDAARGSPRHVADVVSIGSISGRLPTPGRSAYSATKRAVAAFSETLRQETAEAGVRVALVEPGLTRTGLRSQNSACPLESIAHATPQLAGVEPLDPSRVAGAVRFIVCQPSDTAVTDLTVRPIGQAI